MQGRAKDKEMLEAVKGKRQGSREAEKHWQH
jgi:hypothetical protein